MQKQGKSAWYVLLHSSGAPVRSSWRTNRPAIRMERIPGS